MTDLTTRSSVRRAHPGMVLPHAGADGCVSDPLASRDNRVPQPMSRDFAPEVLAAWTGASCPVGRHAWDVITSSTALVDCGSGLFSLALDHGKTPGPATTSETLDGADDEWRRFRMRLTCVRCGRIESLEGLSRDTARGWLEVSPLPLRAGELLAQQIEAPRGRIGLETWSVHRDAGGESIGSVTRHRGRRGSDHYRATLHCWPEDAFARGTTPLTALRSLARMVRATGAHNAASAPTDDGDQMLRKEQS